MTVKHLIEGAIQHTKARHHYHFSMLTGLDNAAVIRMATGKYSGMNIKTLDQIQRTTGVPIDTLFAWYRMPEGAVLGRIRAVAPARLG